MAWCKSWQWPRPDCEVRLNVALNPKTISFLSELLRKAYGRKSYLSSWAGFREEGKEGTKGFLSLLRSHHSLDMWVHSFPPVFPLPGRYQWVGREYSLPGISLGSTDLPGILYKVPEVIHYLLDTVNYRENAGVTLMNSDEHHMLEMKVGVHLSIFLKYYFSTSFTSI